MDTLYQTTANYFDTSVGTVLRYLSDIYEDVEDLWNALTPQRVNDVYYEMRRRGVL